MKQIPRGAQRINRILSLAGIASRRMADEMISAGRITVNGRVVRELGSKASWGQDSIRVDGKEIPKPSDRTYLILNKPFGYICSLKDPEGRAIVTELLKGVPQRVYPVGRLDFNTLGLLLLTNDGDLSHRLTHPRYHVPRTYKAIVEGMITEEALQSLRKGVMLEDGFSGSSNASLIDRSGGKSVIRISVTQGRNRLVRRMIEAVGYPAVHLIRTGFGNLNLGNLKPGQYRYLEPDELSDLKRSVGLGA
jgi:23S rRNA pseudouridine2605 synthase